MNIAANAYQVNNSLLAGNNVNSTYTTTNTVALNYGITGNQSAKIYANQLILTTVGGWDSSENLKSGEFTPFAKGEKNHRCKGQKSAILQGLGGTTQGRIEFFESIKKGSILNASLSSNGNQKKDGVGILNLFVQRRQIISYSFDCLALRCLRLISAFTAVTINCALLSPSSKFFSKSATTSCGKRAFSCWDLLLVELVAITRSPCDWCDSVYAKKNARKGLKCDSLGDKFKSKGAIHQKATPRSATNTIEAFNHNVNRSNTMAMYKSTQTRPKFLWRFFSCQQCKYFIVIASSEQEARSMLPDSPCLFSARFAEGESV